MFESFFKFMNSEQVATIENEREFLQLTAGQSYLNGLYRFFKKSDIEYWNDIVYSCFPNYKEIVTVISYDWMGRIYAIKESTKHIMLFEPGSGDVYDTDADLVKFHDELIVNYPDECLIMELFTQWFNNNPTPLSYSDCVSYIVPLMLGGGDELDNLEVCDMDVYWEILKPFILGK